MDEVVPRSQLLESASRRALEFAARSAASADAQGISLGRLAREVEERRVKYAHMTVEIDRENSTATFVVEGPTQAGAAQR